MVEQYAILKLSLVHSKLLQIESVFLSMVVRYWRYKMHLLIQYPSKNAL